MKDQKEDTQCCVKKQAQDLGRQLHFLSLEAKFIQTVSASEPLFPPHITLGYIVWR